MLKSPESSFTLEASAESTTEQREKTAEEVLADSLIKSTSFFQNTQNAVILYRHLNDRVYRSFVESGESELSDGTPIKETRIRIDRFREELEPPNAMYLFGFDFFDVPICNLTLHDVLLGKSFFGNAQLFSFKSLSSALLECDLTGALTKQSRFENARLVGCDLQTSVHGLDLFVNTTFSDCRLAAAHFDSCCFIRTTFKLCDMEQLRFSGTLLLNCKFDECRGSPVSFSDAFINEQTFDSLKATGALDMNETKIEEVNAGQIETLHFYTYNWTERDFDNPPAEVYLKQKLSMLGLCKIQESDCQLLKSLLTNRPIFIVNREPPTLLL